MKGWFLPARITKKRLNVVTQFTPDTKYVMRRLPHLSTRRCLLVIVALLVLEFPLINLRDMENSSKSKTRRRQQQKRKKLVWFLHYHKAAGTSFIDLAWQNHEVVRHSSTDISAGDNRRGHFELDHTMELRWDLAWPHRSSEVDCHFDPASSSMKLLEETQIKLLEQDFDSLDKKNITFVSSEHWFPPPAVMKHHLQKATWVVLIREPMGRLVSSYHFHKGGENRCPLNKTRCAFADWWPAESNMHVKLLLGIPFGPQKVGKLCARKMITSIEINQNDLDDAIQSLGQFNVVLTLDSFKKEPTKVACVLSRALGWNITSLPKLNVKTNASQPKREHRNIEKVELGRAKDANVWDLKLYQRAQKLEQETFQSTGC